MNKLLLLAALAVAAYFALAPVAPDRPGAEAGPVAASAAGSRSDAVIEQAFAKRLSDRQVEGQGTVVKTLADDTNGSRHQRFIVRLESGQTLLVSHNIDLAPRIDALRAGDTVAFYGEYEWNPKGGVIHWTHHDPQGRHPAGWIRHAGQTYQ
jgi:molybdopterin converting factor small subunit